MTAKKAAKKTPAGKKATRAKKSVGKKKAAKQEISSLSVHLGHVFALRPRVSASFRQEDFMAARRLLEDESYASIEEAARAVAERALSLSNDPKGKRGFKPRR